MQLKPSENAVGAWVQLVRTEQTILARVEAELKEHGFPPLEWYDVLLELDATHDGRLPQAQVQSRVLLAQYNLCRLVDRLEREGLVKRQPSPDDGRSNLLVITEKGRELRRRMWPVYASAIEAHLGSRLSCEEARQLADLLGRLVSPEKPVVDIQNS
ncbi:MAG: MarR family winged helix-turn-helix transcriptional regulator [Hyphomicrobiaceae bacterium]